MYPLHDNDLDRLSRNAAEHYEVDSGSSGWEQLEKRLDQELPPPRDRRRFLFWLFFIVVTTGSALTGLLISSQPNPPFANNIRLAPANRMQANTSAERIGRQAEESIADNEQTKSVNGQAADKKDGRVVTGPATVDDNGNTSPKIDAGNNPPIQGNNTSIKKRTTTPNNVIVAETFNKKPTRAIRQVNSRKPDQAAANIDPINANKAKTQQRVGNTTATNQQPEGDATAITQQPANNTTLATQQPAGHPTPTTRQSTDSTIASTAPLKPAGTDSTAAEKSDKPKIPHNYKQTWEFGVTAGPDASMVEFGPLFKAGYNFGIQIGYRFNDRWSVNTGLIYTRKYYEADSTNFTAPKGSYISYVNLHVLKGYCAMLDIPLNIRYDISHNDKRRFFASAGASTYLMNRQAYDYWYTYDQDPDVREKPWDSKTDKDYRKENYLFSVLNLSVGYERMLSKRFSIQAEPYFKLPLAGMGYGTMKIGSYGMFFSLKYHPTFRSTSKK